MLREHSGPTICPNNTLAQVNATALVFHQRPKMVDGQTGSTFLRQNAEIPWKRSPALGQDAVTASGDPRSCHREPQSLPSTFFSMLWSPRGSHHRNEVCMCHNNHYNRSRMFVGHGKTRWAMASPPQRVMERWQKRFSIRHQGKHDMAVGEAVGSPHQDPLPSGP